MLQQIEEACPIGAHAALIVPPTWVIRVRRNQVTPPSVSVLSATDPNVWICLSRCLWLQCLWLQCLWLQCLWLQCLSLQCLSQSSMKSSKKKKRTSFKRKCSKKGAEVSAALCEDPISCVCICICFFGTWLVKRGWQSCLLSFLGSMFGSDTSCRLDILPQSLWADHVFVLTGRTHVEAVYHPTHPLTADEASAGVCQPQEWRGTR